MCIKYCIRHPTISTILTAPGDISRVNQFTWCQHCIISSYLVACSWSWCGTLPRNIYLSIFLSTCQRESEERNFHLQSGDILLCRLPHPQTVPRKLASLKYHFALTQCGNTYCLSKSNLTTRKLSNNKGAVELYLRTGCGITDFKPALIDNQMTDRRIPHESHIREKGHFMS
jgi:hypothetical protein